MVLFEEAQAEDQSFQVLLEDSNDSGYNFTLPLTTHNPYTFSFKAPGKNDVSALYIIYVT
jgi:hypothetical protein